MGNVTYCRKDGLIAADMDGETVMMDIMTGKYYNLGRSGGAIWEIIEKPCTRDEIVDALLKRFDVERSVCEEQTQAFLDSLIASRLAVKEEK
jgi:hypothetical protein